MISLLKSTAWFVIFAHNLLKKVFGKEDSVNDIVVNLDNQSVTIDIKEDQDLSDEKNQRAH